MVTSRKVLVAITMAAVLVAVSKGAQAGLVAHYPLDAISAGTTPDTTGVNGAGTLNGNPIIRATGQIGPSFEFTNSTSQFVGISDPAFGKTAFTASVWIRPDNVANQGPLAQWTNAGPSPRSVLIRTEGGGNVQTYLRSGSVQRGGTVSFPTQSLSTASFGLITVAYDGQNIFTYLNGEKSTTVNSFPAANTVIGEGVLGTMGIGGRGGSERVADGHIDDVSFFDAQLSDAKIRALYTVASEPGLDYDAGKADLLFQVFDGAVPGATMGTLAWSQAPDGTLTGSAGDVVDLGGGNYGVILNGSGGGVVSSMPAPGSYAAFDVNYSGNPTAIQPGFAGMDDATTSSSMTSFSATQNGVTLTVTSPGNQDRDRGIDADLAGHPNNILLSDFAFANSGTRLTVDVSGLKPNTEYVLRMHGHDTTSSNQGGGLWFEGTPATLSAQDPDFLAAHVIFSGLPDAADYDLRLRSSPTGTIQLTGRGAGFVTSNATLALNGLEVFEAPRFMDDVIKVDVDNINPGGGPMNRTEPGFVPLTLSGIGSTTGSVTDNGVTVTITTDRTDTASRDRDNTGEALVADWIFGSALDIQIDGLVPGQEYEVTIWSQDTDGNRDYSSLWYQDGSLVPFRAGHLSVDNELNLDAASFTAFLTPTSTSMLLEAVPANPIRNYVFINGIQFRTVPEPGTIVLLGLGGLFMVGWRVRRRRTA